MNEIDNSPLRRRTLLLLGCTDTVLNVVRRPKCRSRPRGCNADHHHSLAGQPVFVGAATHTHTHTHRLGKVGTWRPNPKHTHPGTRRRGTAKSRHRRPTTAGHTPVHPQPWSARESCSARRPCPTSPPKRSGVPCPSSSPATTSVRTRRTVSQSACRIPRMALPSRLLLPSHMRMFLLLYPHMLLLLLLLPPLRLQLRLLLRLPVLRAMRL